MVSDKMSIEECISSLRDRVFGILDDKFAVSNVAFFIGVTPRTLNKFLSGDMDLTVATLLKIQQWSDSMLLSRGED